MSLTFDPVEHRYYWNKERVPGVSEILKSLGLLKDYANVDPFYKERGIAVHKCIELFLKGTLDEATVDPVCIPYFEEFKAWWDKNGSRPNAMELILYSKIYNFAGTIDLVTDKIWDYKCTKSVAPATELQGAAYRILWNENFGEDLPFETLQLPGNGLAIPIPYQAEPHLWNSVIDLYYGWKVRK